MSRRDPSLYYAIGFGLLVVGLTVGQNLLGGGGKTASTGQPAPEVSVRRLTGETLALTELRGKVVLVDFWARWCQPCVAMMPELQRLTDRMTGKPFELLSINVEGVAPGRIKSWLKQRGFTFQSAQDIGGAAQRAYDVSTLPRLVLIDAQGVVRKTYGGGTGEDRLASDIEKLLPAA